MLRFNQVYFIRKLCHFLYAFCGVFGRTGAVDEDVISSSMSEALNERSLHKVGCTKAGGLWPTSRINSLPWALMICIRHCASEFNPSWMLLSQILLKFWLFKMSTESLTMLLFVSLKSRPVSLTRYSLQPFNFAQFSNTVMGQHYGPMTTGTPFLIIPAFWYAIFQRVSPKMAVWSQPIEVMMLKMGKTVLVESYRPPIPVSNTTTSHFLKYSKAIAVNISKKCSFNFYLCIVSETLLQMSANQLSDMSLPSIAILQVNEKMCGELYSPVLYPADDRILEILWHTEPFPLVPAT